MYGKVHQSLARVFTTRSAIEEKELAEVVTLIKSIRKVEAGHPEDLTPAELVKNINKKLKPLRMRIASARSDYNGFTYYGLTSKFKAPPTEKSAEFNQLEIVYLRKILRTMCENKGRMTIAELKDLQVGIKQIETVDIEFTIAKFEVVQYLKRHSRDEFEVGPRALFELGGFLDRVTEHDVQNECVICSERCLFTPRNCPQCPARIHSWCIDSWVETCQSEGNALTCPNCRVDWSNI